MRHLFTVEILSADSDDHWIAEPPAPNATLIEWRVVPGTWAAAAGGAVNGIVIVVHWSVAP